MPFDFRVSIYTPTFGALAATGDVAVSDLIGGTIEYEDTPSGCGAGKLTLGITYETAIARGYYRGLNIVEISSGDNTLKTSAAAGANKYYLDSTYGFDPAQGEDAQQAYFYDGSTLTMRVPVTGIGSDAGGPYITTSAPLGGGSVPAYVAGTIVGRRRYTGRIIRRAISVARLPGGIEVDLLGLSVSFTQAYGTFTIGAAANVDVSSAIYEGLSGNGFVSSHWPFLASFASSDFPATGSTYHGTLTNVGCDRLIADALGSITSSDQWFVRVGHDRKPRMVKYFTQSTNTYTYNVTLTQGFTEFEPTSITFQDEDSSNIYNAIMVTGDSDATTGQPVSAIVLDSTAATLVGFQIDGAPVSNVGIKDVTAAAAYGLGLVDQYALPVAKNQLLVYTQNDTVTGPTPGSMKSGDVVRACANVIVAGFDQQGLVPNWTPDSGIAYGLGTNALWTTSGSPSVVAGGSPDGFNAWSIAALGGGTAQAVAAPCTPGQKWTFTGYINASAVASGSGTYQWVLVDVTHNATLATVGTTGIGTPTPVTATIPAGCTSIALRAYVQSHTGATGSVAFAQPNLVLGSTIAPYVPNLAAPNSNGLPTSVVTTIDFDKQDSQQSVTFNAIEPSFQDFVSEGLNAVSTQLRTNIAKLDAIDQFCVSTNARTFSFVTTSLVLTVPAYLAQFAQGSTLVSIPAGTVTLTAKATNWVWLQSTGTYIVYTSATPLAGAILYGIFQCNATGIIGGVFKASVGVFTVGVGNVNFAANLPAPTFTGVSVANGTSLNGLAADIVASLTLTNVPTDGSAVGVEFYFRPSGGSGKWIAYEGQNLTLGSGGIYPTASQAQSFEYGDMTNGTTYDLGVGYLGLAGYGAVSTFASSFAAKTIAVDATYMYRGSSPTPAFTGASATNGYSANGVSAAVILQFTATNQPTDKSLSRLNLWVRVSAQGGSNVVGASTFYWSPYGGQPAIGVGTASPSASGTYYFNLADLTNGQTYDFGVTYEDNSGGESSTIGIAVASFVATALNLPTTGNAPMPSAISTNGPNVTAGAVGTHVAAGSGVVGLPITFSIGDWAAGAQPGWFSGFVFYWRQHGTTAAHACGTLGVTSVVSGIATSLMVPAAITVDLGIAYEGAQSVQSAIVWPSYFASISTEPISPPASVAGTDSGNLVPDGQLAHVLSAGNEAYWYEYLIDGVSFLALPTGDSTTYGLFSWTSGANGSTRYANSQPFSLVAGTAYTMSAYIDLVNATGTGGVRVIALSGTASNTNPANAATSIASILKAGGSSGKFSFTFTPSTSGKYVFQASNSGITVGGSPIFMGQFQVEKGSAFTGFKPNTPVQTQGSDAGTTAHIAASQPVQSTVTPTAGSEGSFLASSAVARRHIAGNTGFNFVFNPSPAQNTLGWSTSDSTAHATFSHDAQWGGRFIIAVPSGTLSGTDALWYQYVTVVPSTTYTVSGNAYCNVLPSGGQVFVDAYTTSSIGASTPLTVASNALVPFSFSFTTGASTTSVQIRLRAATGGTSPTSSTSAAFWALKVEYGLVSTPHSDDTATSLVPTTHSQTAGADGSNLLPGLVAGRHLVGATSTDTAAIADTTGKILHTRHSLAVQSTLGAAAGADGLFTLPNQLARRHLVGGTGGNMIPNPTARNSTYGWTTANDSGAATFSHDTYLGGRFGVVIPAGSHTGADAYYMSTAIGCFGGYTYTLSGKVEVDGVNAGGYAIIDAFDNSSTPNFYYLATVTTGGQNFVSGSFTTVSGATTLTVRLRIYAGSNSPTVATIAYFYAPQLELGTVASEFGDHTTAAAAAVTHQTTVGGEGSFLRSQIVSARHFSGGNASDAGAMVDATSKLLHTRHSPAVQATIGATAGSDGLYTLPNQISRRHLVGPLSANLLFNPTAGQNNQGWTPYDATGNATFSRDNQWGGRFILTIASGAASGTDALFYQILTVQPSTSYTLSGNYYANGVPTSGFVTVDAYAISGSVSGTSIAPNLTSASGTIFPFAITFTTSSSCTSVQIRLRANCGTTSPSSSTSGAFSQLKLEQNTAATPYSDEFADGVVNGVFNASAQAPKSSFLNAQSSVLPYTTDVVLTLTAPSGGTQINASTNAGHFYLPDGSTVAASASAHNFTGLTSGATYYVVAYCPSTGGTLTFQIAGSGNFSPSAYAAFLGDGFALLVSPVATPAVGSGGSGGGGGCPGVDQAIETREAGFIRAGDVVQGMRVRHPDDSWRVVEWVGKPHAALMYRVTFDTEAVVVDASHLFERELGSDRWTNVADLEPGDRFCRSRGHDELRVQRVERLGNGLFVPLHVDGMRYRLGRTVSHNAKNHLQ